ncbi:DUF2969 domain-containing protein [Streptococcus sciuri]|uniref:DUF2969 domain-containing protein n=1 Tax=Streptococcus sciuri TaxID=2973939 RepID=A0ABT2F5L2_9STRE|nr:DUF2969 domain-containing protein [Streptococcus sciuri]MCS4487744.1 DUF2969 domain-containing protein [Streptococcus sciuri]
MAKKDKKIEIQLIDAKVKVNETFVDGSQLVIGKRIVGNIVELDGKYAVIKNEQVASFYKSLDQAIENVIEEYNLNH